MTAERETRLYSKAKAMKSVLLFDALSVWSPNFLLVLWFIRLVF
jgi:hypothetical protein